MIRFYRYLEIPSCTGREVWREIKFLQIGQFIVELLELCYENHQVVLYY